MAATHSFEEVLVAKTFFILYIYLRDGTGMGLPRPESRHKNFGTGNSRPKGAWDGMGQPGWEILNSPSPIFSFRSLYHFFLNKFNSLILLGFGLKSVEELCSPASASILFAISPSNAMSLPKNRLNLVAKK